MARHLAQGTTHALLSVRSAPAAARPGSPRPWH
jgi:hypothetical protein